MRHDLILGAFSLPGNKNNYQRKKLFHFITQMKKRKNIQTSSLKVSKCGVISGPYFPAFGLYAEIYGVDLRRFTLRESIL